MQKYIDALYNAMQEVMERPVSLGRAEEVKTYAKTIHALEGLERCEKRERFTKEDAKNWVRHMENEDGSTGEQWTMDATREFKKEMGVDVPDCVWYATMNMMRSDYYKVARKHGVDKPEFYADMAKAFLLDEDAPEAEEKLAAYYHCIAE